MTFEILQTIIVGTFFIFLLLCLIVCLLFGIKWLILWPLSCYYTKRGANKLQWKAIETPSSMERRISDPYKDEINEFYLEWRILPSELPLIVSVYGYNEWEKFVQTENIKFINEQKFKETVARFKTLKDLRDYYNKVGEQIVWYEP